MDRLITVALATIVLWSISSCSQPTQFSKEIAVLDSLETRLLADQKLLDSLMATGLEDWQPQVTEKLKYLNTHLTDSLHRDFWLNEMNFLSQAEKAFRRLTANHVSLSEKMAYNLKQQQTLENSLRDNKLTPEEAQKYLEQEIAAYQQEAVMMGKAVYGSKLGMARWNIIAPRIDSAIAHLKAKELP